jgi:hypothetical protein
MNHDAPSLHLTIAVDSIHRLPHFSALSLAEFAAFVCLRRLQINRCWLRATLSPCPPHLSKVYDAREDQTRGLGRHHALSIEAHVLPGQFPLHHLQLLFGEILADADELCVNVPSTLDVLPRTTRPENDTPYDSVDIFSNVSDPWVLTLSGLSQLGDRESNAGVHIPAPRLRAILFTNCWLYPLLCQGLKAALTARHDAGAPPLKLVLGQGAGIRRADYDDLCRSCSGIASITGRGGMFVIKPGGQDEKQMQDVAAKAERTALLRAEWAAQTTAQFKRTDIS